MPYTHDPCTPTGASEEPHRAHTRDRNPINRRDLRRRWNQGLPQQVVRRPGARFYVTIRDGDRVGFLLGPYACHMTALANVERGRQLAIALRPDQAAFATFGTASHPHTLSTVFGR
jgi:hypothetical protein